MKIRRSLREDLNAGAWDHTFRALPNQPQPSMHSRILHFHVVVDMDSDKLPVIWDERLIDGTMINRSTY